MLDSRTLELGFDPTKKPSFDYTRFYGLKQGHPLSIGLVGAWIMNVGGGNLIYDLSGNGRIGVFGGDPFWVPSGINFDSNDYITVGKSLAGGENAFTVCSLAKASETTVSKQICMEVSAFNISRRDDSGGRWQCYVYNDATNVNALGSSNYANNNWQSVAGVFTGSEVYIYVDGKSDDSTPPSITGPIKDLNNNFTIGRTTVNSWQGDIAYVYVYNRALTASEIAWLHRDPYAMFRQDEIALFVAYGAGGGPYSLVCDGGSLSLTGAAAGTEKGSLLSAGAGGLELTGAAVTFSREYLVPAGSGGFDITGADSTMLRALLLDIGSGGFAITGADAILAKGRTLAAEAGGLAITGAAAALLKGSGIGAGAGAFTITGADAALTKSSDFTLTVEPGSYNITGQDAQFLRGLLIAAGAGVFVVTGQNVNLSYSGAAVSTKRKSLLILGVGQ